MVLDYGSQLIQDDFTKETAPYSSGLWGGRGFYDVRNSKFHIMLHNRPLVPGYVENGLNIPHMCPEHGLVMVHNNRWRKCPLCLHNDSVYKCAVCGENYHDPRRKSNQSKIHICPECFKKLPGYDPNARQLTIRKCSHHGYYLETVHWLKHCPACSEEINDMYPRQC